VTGKQWMWKTQHPTGQREINELHLPLGRPVRLTMTSEDVIHSFYVPAFRAKADVVPGRYTSMWFTPTKPGRYRLFCTEYCGAEHSRMIGWVTVLGTEAYQTWLAEVPAQRTPAEEGGELYARLGCAECHEGGGRRGPELEGLYGREVRLASGKSVTADETYLRESIFDPGAKVVAGFERTMPSFRGRLDEEQMHTLVRYLKGLPETRAAAAPGTAESVVR
jgi:cytochrome c oxidase subunit 2